MRKILILGSGGRLGAALARIYGSSDFEVAGLNHAAVDLNSSESVQEQVTPLDFDVLINCAALTDVDYCETHQEEALRINAYAARELAQICEKKRARLIHISTDYVFEGVKSSPYMEEDPAHPISVYGESKLRGEQEVLGVSERHLVVRVSWVFGPDRPSFIDGILKRALSEDRAEAIADKFSAPAFTLDVAEYLRPFIEKIPEGGLLHLCNSGQCSWREYGQFAMDCAARAGVRLKAAHVHPLKLEEMKSFVAKRPIYTVLSTDKITRLTGRKPRSWQDAVEAYVKAKYAPAG